GALLAVRGGRDAWAAGRACRISRNLEARRRFREANRNVVEGAGPPEAGSACADRHSSLAGRRGATAGRVFSGGVAIGTPAQCSWALGVVWEDRRNIPRDVVQRDGARIARAHNSLYL